MLQQFVTSHLSRNCLQHSGVHSGSPRLISSNLEWCYSSINPQIFSTPCSGMISPRHSQFRLTASTLSKRMLVSHKLSEAPESQGALSPCRKLRSSTLLFIDFSPMVPTRVAWAQVFQKSEKNGTGLLSTIKRNLIRSGATLERKMGCPLLSKNETHDLGSPPPNKNIVGSKVA